MQSHQANHHGKTSRRRLNHDPNNTKWSRDTKTFGQKILRAQGWQPGEFLGAQNALHSEHLTAASASHIRVTLKDDMKGLGFNKRKEDEITGMDEFSDLLSRLNGKSDKAVEEARQARLEVKMNAYVMSRYGAMRFVRGGLLVGDEMKGEEGKEVASSSSREASPAATNAADVEDNKAKKRKAASLDEDDDNSAKDSEEKSKKRRKGEKKSKKRSKEASSEDTEGEKLKPRKKERSKDKDKSSGDEDEEASSAVEGDADSAERSAKRKSKSKKDAQESAESSDLDDDTKAKKSKKERKEEKRARKERKREKKRKKREAESASALSSTDATPAGSGTSTPRNARHVRSRFLAAKREALMDDKALNKVCFPRLLCQAKSSSNRTSRSGWSRHKRSMHRPVLLYDI